MHNLAERVELALDNYEKAHPELSYEECKAHDRAVEIVKIAVQHSEFHNSAYLLHRVHMLESEVTGLKHQHSIEYTKTKDYLSKLRGVLNRMRDRISSQNADTRNLKQQVEYLRPLAQKS